MAQLPVTSARCSAPSFKSWKIADPSFKGFGKDSRGRGAVPGKRVALAYDAQGYAWVHFAILGPNKAKEIADAVEARGWIDTAHWRKADRREY